MKRNKKTKDSAAKVGVRDFTDLMAAGHPCWSLLAVRAEARYVTRAFGEIRKVLQWDRDVPIKPIQKFEPVPKLTAFVEIVGNPWTVVLRSLFRVGKEELEGLDQEAETISRTVKSSAVTFLGEDTAGTLNYAFYDGGREVEKASWTLGGAFDLFVSKVRRQPKLKNVGVEFADEVFRSHGIYLPACYPQQTDEKAWLAVHECSTGAIRYVDLATVGKIDTPTFDEVFARLVAKVDKFAKRKKRKGE